MNPVEYHLKQVIYRWCTATPNQYVVDSVLRDIWSAHVPQIPYEPEGIKKFFVTLYQDPFFLNCTAAHHMTPGEFLAGGDLQTVKQVFTRLLPCVTSPVNPNEPPTFQ
jgi:hypothetical protein